MPVAGSTTASDVVAPGPEGPTRMCIGCRKRAAATELFRVVVGPERSDPVFNRPVDGPGDRARGPVAVSVLPDPRRRAPGRGAWLHPRAECVALADRRRAVARSLRISGPTDLSAVHEYVARFDPVTPPAESRRS